jgi:hypothetical protein
MIMTLALFDFSFLKGVQFSAWRSDEAQSRKKEDRTPHSISAVGRETSVSKADGPPFIMRQTMEMLKLSGDASPWEDVR